MVTAYVMVKALSGDADRLQSEIEAVDGVAEASIVAGDVDFIAKVEVDSPAEVKDVAADGIQSIDDIEDTQTYIAMD
ncbi:Lrp/AsnC family transcriptional regulator [Halorientalis salina]|uniref:Lrp/AsnC family transcriptional regulator n=1 Tax=Halorientalis salina TaxID=2932266 RepID=UPI0010AC0B8D|nr:Lrp/AsnC ligand binding domain-containing protein [Halorientalis salina]